MRFVMPDPRDTENGHADDCEMMVKLLTGWRCTCGYDRDAEAQDAPRKIKVKVVAQ